MEATVWASFRPFTARQQLQQGESGPITLADARFVVRASSGVWRTADTLTFQGSSWTVKGVSELLGRERYLELVARRIS